MSPKKKKAWRARMNAWFYDNREYKRGYVRYQRMLARRKDRIRKQHLTRLNPLLWDAEIGQRDAIRKMEADLYKSLFQSYLAEAQKNPT